MKNFDAKKIRILFCPTAAMIAMIVVCFVFSYVLGIIMTVVCILSVILALLLFAKPEIAPAQMESPERAVIDEIDIPIVLVDNEGILRFCNAAFNGLFEDNQNNMGISGVIPELSLHWEVAADNIPIKDRRFSTKTREIISENTVLSMLTFIDCTELYDIKQKFTGENSVMIFLQIDNYDDLMSSTEHSYQGVVIAETGKVLGEHFKSLEGFCLKIERDKYFASVERKKFDILQSKKFSLLDEVREINVGNTIQITLSIGAGIGANPSQAASFAQQALELALGRGGDQAAVKIGDRHSFYGGKMQAVEKRAKVKSRIISHALRNLMQNCENIIIMGHKEPDLDCIGAAVGLFRCAKFIGKNAKVVWSSSNMGIDSIISVLQSNGEYSDVLISHAEAEKIANEKAMLIVVDTQLADITEMPSLINKCGVLVLIDHHRRGEKYIKNATLAHLEPYSSSVCELVTEIIQYFGDGLKLLPLESEALLCGIMMDTKRFAVKTGARTFEAAGYLKRCGADISAASQHLLDDIDTFTARTDVVRSARKIADGIMLAICKETEKAHLVTAQAADTLLTIKGVDASFVISREDNDIIVSGRSSGKINVQIIMEKLGGGGHMTVAGTRMFGISEEDAERQITEAVEAYLKEVN